MKNGSGGVCHRVEAGWLTHCGTEAEDAEDVQETHTGHEVSRKNAGGHTSVSLSSPPPF